MPTTSQPTKFDPTSLNRIRPLCLELQQYLSGMKGALEAEIRSYPTPIPRCDAQFNHLYAQRSRLCQILDRVSGALAERDPSRALTETIAEFIASPAFGENAEEQRLRERLRAELSRSPRLAPEPTSTAS